MSTGDPPATFARTHYHACNSGSGCASIGTDIDEAYGQGYDACAEEMNDKVIREIKRAHRQGITEGLRQAAAAVRAQANLPDLVHFDRPSDFRKGVLSCLAALEAIEGKPDA